MIRCSEGEGRRIRAQAAEERRSISGYILNILGRALRVAQPYFDMVDGIAGNVVPLRPARASGPRTSMLLCCSMEEANQIRNAAKRFDVTISDYILHCLRRSWKAKDPSYDTFGQTMR